jgi:hypothetical protein
LRLCSTFLAGCYLRRQASNACLEFPYRIMYTVEGDLITILRVDRGAG